MFTINRRGGYKISIYIIIWVPILFVSSISSRVYFSNVLLIN